MRMGLVSLLTGESTISDIVGSRVYVDKAPQKADFPYIVITQIGSDELYAMDGTTGLRFVDFDLDCKADRAVESYTLGNAVREFIKDYTGAAGTQTISAVLLNEESTEVEPPPDGSDKAIHVTLLDVQIQYSPA